MGSSQGIREVAGDYLWIEGAQDSYLQDKRKLIKNRDWDAGLDCLKRDMGNSWWEWSVVSRCFFWRWQREFQSGIRDFQNQWQVGPWPLFLQNL